VDIAGYDARPENVCMTLDYKLPDSGMEQFMRTENYAWLKPQDAVKFVVSSIRDLETAKKIIETYDLCAKATVYLSSAFSAITPAQIVEYMIQENMKDVRLQLQMHKYIWDPEKKGV
jgi:7-carboxy-7-deazaguanine synthase